ncbi:alkyl sulfatase C-terminal domain-containing protein [Legionella beliardensis]|nr:alkyl sulfatase C-terminal domain-containing protein [Legionella beliardensis]
MNQIILKNKILQQAIDTNEIKTEGKKDALNQLLSFIDTFDF